MGYQTRNPYTEELLESFPEHTDLDLEQFLARAAAAYAHWRRVSYAQRGEVIRKAAAILREEGDRFARLITLEMGKLLAEARKEVALCARIFDYYAEHAEPFLAPRPIDTQRGLATVETGPLGLLFCIEPWNFPFYQLARVAAPNLMAGNVLMVKHAPNVPQCARAFEELLLDAGAPAGAYTNVFLSNEQAAFAIADVRVRGVALTGSERAGAAVAAEAGKALKKTTMELGGSDAFIVLADADMDTAVRLAVEGRMTNAGQVCDGAKRFILDESIAAEFLERFAAALARLLPGDPAHADTTLAPLCSEAALELALRQIAAAVEGGARVLAGGTRLGTTGYFLAPTILTGIGPNNPAYRQEFFAPVALVFIVEDEEQAVALANDSPYGLGGSIVTTDIARGRALASRIDTGMVFINAPAVSSPELPFGGVKNSGYGRELSDLGIAEFVNRKLVLSVA